MNAAERRRRADRLDRLARLLDARFEIPGTGIRIGLDGLVGLIPGVGDTLTTLVSLYLVIEARRIGVPRRALIAMLVNIALDWAIGLIPLVGDILDIGFKANLRNIAILKRHL